MFKAEHPRNFWGLLNKDELCVQKKGREEKKKDINNKEASQSPL